MCVRVCACVCWVYMFVNNLNFPLTIRKFLFWSLFCSLTHTRTHAHTHIYKLIYSHSFVLSPLALFFCCQNSFGCWFGKLIVHCCSPRYWNIVSTYVNFERECVWVLVPGSICVCVCGCILVENNNFSDLRYVQTLDK